MDDLDMRRNRTEMAFGIAVMFARENAAISPSRTAAAILGVRTFTASRTPNHSGPSTQSSGDWSRCPSQIMSPDLECGRSSYVHEHLRSEPPRNCHSDIWLSAGGWVADLQRQIRTYTSGSRTSCDGKRNAPSRPAFPTATTAFAASPGTNWRLFNRRCRTDHRYSQEHGA
jgi:hypothetical protein